MKKIKNSYQMAKSSCSTYGLILPHDHTCFLEDKVSILQQEAFWTGLNFLNLITT